jgi:hypothetical protein
MATLREVFVNWQIKSNLAAEMKKLDDAIEETSDEFKRLADEAEKAAKDTADQWGKVGDKARDVGKGIAAGIGVGVTALVGAAAAAGSFVAQWAHGAAQVESTAKQFGISAQALQEWQYAARATGGEAEGIVGIFKELDLRLAEVGETGTGSAADALTLLKLRVEDLRRLRPEQQMEAIADRLSTISDVGARTFIKDSLFGGEYEKIGSLLEQGAAGIATLRKEANALGGVLDGKALEGAKEFNRELIKTEAIVDGVRSTIAQSLLPIVRDLVHRFGEWVARNRELIATKSEEWAKRLAGWIEQLAPLIGKVATATGEFVDQLGGIEPALKLAAGGWLAWQAAGLAAIGNVGAALAVFMASFAAGMAIGKAIMPGDSPEVQRVKAGQAKIRQYSQFIDEFANDTSLNGQIARKNFEIGLMRLEQNPYDSKAEAQVKAAIAEFERIKYARSNAGGSQVGNAELGRIAKPGAGGAQLTTESLLKEQRKQDAELEKLRKIRSDLEARRMNAQGAERMTIERTLADVNKRLTGQEVQTPEQIIAGLMGQGTNLGAGALRPAGLGTSVNQIDARVIVNVGGIDVEMPASAIDPNSPRTSGQSFGEGIAAQLSQWIGQAFQLQRAQING